MLSEFIDFLNAVLVFILLSALYKRQWAQSFFDFEGRSRWIENLLLGAWLLIAGMSVVSFALKFYQWLGS